MDQLLLIRLEPLKETSFTPQDIYDEIYTRLKTSVKSLSKGKARKPVMQFLSDSDFDGSVDGNDLYIRFNNPGGMCDLEQNACIHWFAMCYYGLFPQLQFIVNDMGYRLEDLGDELQDVLNQSPNTPMIEIRDKLYSISYGEQEILLYTNDEELDPATLDPKDRMRLAKLEKEKSCGCIVCNRLRKTGRDVYTSEYRIKLPEVLEPMKENAKVSDYFSRVENNALYWTAWHNLGAAYSKAGKEEAALTCYEISVKVFPENALAYYNMGAIYLSRKELDQAKQNFLLAARAEPKNGTYDLSLGEIYSKEGQRELAIAHLTAAVKKSPKDRHCNVNAGFYLLLNGKPDLAMKCIEKAILLGEATFSPINKGHVHLIRGEKDLAVSAYVSSLYSFAGLGKESGFWRDYDSDFQVVSQYGISQEYYDGLKAEIRAAGQKQ